MLFLLTETNIFALTKTSNYILSIFSYKINPEKTPLYVVVFDMLISMLYDYSFFIISLKVPPLLDLILAFSHERKKKPFKKSSLFAETSAILTSSCIWN